MNMFASQRQGWKSAEAAQGGYPMLPDGAYTFKIESVKGRQAQNGTALIEWVLLTKTDDGSEVHTQKTNRWNDSGFPYLKADFKALGVDPDQIEPLYMEQWFEYFTGAYVTANVRNTEKDGKKYNNIYFSGLYRPISKTPPEQTANTSEFAQVEDEDELPF